MFKITKSFEFDYGHRVWSQKLDTDLSLDNKCVCRHLHGHRGVVTVELEAEELKEGMVTDFKHLNFFKQFIDEVIDHRFLIDVNDPMFDKLLNQVVHLCDHFRENAKEMTYQVVPTNDIDRDALKLTDADIEYLDSFVIVDFVPTSENLSKWLYDIISVTLEPKGIKVKSVTFKETPNSSARFE